MPRVPIRRYNRRSPKRRRECEPRARTQTASCKSRRRSSCISHEPACARAARCGVACDSEIKEGEPVSLRWKNRFACLAAVALSGFLSHSATAAIIASFNSLPVNTAMASFTDPTAGITFVNPTSADGNGFAIQPVRWGRLPAEHDAGQCLDRPAALCGKLLLARMNSRSR